MPATFTIQGELSHQGLLEARTAIDDLLTEKILAPIDEADIPDASELALRKARLFKEWAGEASWFFLYMIAERVGPDQEVTFEGLCDVFAANKETIKSWHRSASKIMNKVNAELGTEPRFLHARWDGQRQHYTMSKVMHDAIMEVDAL
jgi:hypothetical protein